jgi:hypothetical protein
VQRESDHAAKPHPSRRDLSPGNRAGRRSGRGAVAVQGAGKETDPGRAQGETGAREGLQGGDGQDPGQKGRRRSLGRHPPGAGTASDGEEQAVAKQRRRLVRVGC